MQVQHGTRPFEPHQHATAYDLLTPAPPPPGATAAPPAPFFLLLHGFMGARAHVAGHAAALCSQGAVVLNASLSSLVSPSPAAAQERNIAQAVAHVRWALALPGPLVDAQRVFLCGHSAGGAVALEAAVALRAAGVAVRGLCLLDGVPWPRTELAALALFEQPQPLGVLSLRSEPGAWNLQGRMQGVLTAAWARRSGSSGSSASQCCVDALLRQSGHADAINPPQRGLLASLLGLQGPPRCAALYAQLLLAFAAAGGELASGALAELLQQLAAQGALAVAVASH